MEDEMYTYFRYIEYSKCVLKTINSKQFSSQQPSLLNEIITTIGFFMIS